ncbi:Plant UBX domain-containing protein 1 [Ranunculus cassubicifolius]
MASLEEKTMSSADPLDSDAAKAKLVAVSEELGREIRVFTTSPTSTSVTVIRDEPDDFYELTTEEYLRVMSRKKDDKFLKTRKIREAEEAARRSKITKAVIRVRFPDNHTLEVKFHPSETFQELIDLLKKVVARPDLPFYIYTTPPKKQIKDFSQDFYSAGFIPGAIVYFSYDSPPKSDDDECDDPKPVPFLRDMIQSLNDLQIASENPEPVKSDPEPAIVGSSDDVLEPKPAGKKPAKPKWFKR